MNIHYDLNGKKISEGDKVVIGYDNGSTLMICKVVKVTKKKIFVKHKDADERNYVRSPDRVVVIS